MNAIYAKDCVTRLLASLPEKKGFTPDEMVKNLETSTFVYIGKNTDIKGNPKFGYLKSNIKGVYYVIYCDSCHARCRKAHLAELNINESKVIKILCYKCAGVKYERKPASEKRALEFLLNPEKHLNMNINNMSLNQSLAFLEAGFMQDKIRERAEMNVSKYMGIN